METHAVVRDPVAATVAALDARIAEISAEIVQHILTENRPLREDLAVVELMSASVEANVTTAVHAIAHGIPVEGLEAPPAAVEYARRLAQRNTPIGLLIRAYRLGHATFMRHAYGELAAFVTDKETALAASKTLTELTFAYIDLVTEQVVSVYFRERDQWLRHAAAIRTAQVRALLEGRDVDVGIVESALGYRLGCSHLGVVAWVSGADGDDVSAVNFEPLAQRLAELPAARGRPLLVPRDESSAWLWVPVDGKTPIEADHLMPAVQAMECGIWLAVGDVAAGVAGFRKTLRDAQRAQTVAVAAGPSGRRVTMYAQVAPIALMAEDLHGTRDWVHRTLGRLAVDDDVHLRLRETLFEFLAAGRSYTETAERLCVHKNTVLYRVRKAEEIRGRPVGAQWLDVQLALLACQWLGPAVLMPHS